MGLAPSGDYTCQITDQAVEGISNVVKSVDNALVQDAGTGPRALITSLEEVLMSFRKHVIFASAKKLCVGSRVEFGDAIIIGGPEGVKIVPNPQRIQALCEIRCHGAERRFKCTSGLCVA